MLLLPATWSQSQCHVFYILTTAVPRFWYQFLYQLAFFLHNKPYQLLVAEKTNIYLAHNSVGHQFGLNSAKWSFCWFWMCFLIHLQSNVGHLESAALWGDWLSVWAVGLTEPYISQYVLGYPRSNNMEALFKSLLLCHV